MLQIYDKLKSTSLLALAAAGGLAMSATAMAETACTMHDGYGAALSDYVAEATACIAQSDEIRTDMETGLAEQISFARAALGLSALEMRPSLQIAARAHALDMAARDYAAHVDLEGRDHAFRIGSFDRSMLVGASGANIMVVSADTDLDDIFNQMGQDVQNAQNVVHEGFTDFGIGIVQSGDRIYVNVMFAAKEGELDEALPLALAGRTSLSAELSRDLSRAVGWSVEDYNSGLKLGQSSVLSIRDGRLKGADAASLTVIVNDRENLYELKGPLLSAR